MVEDRMRYPRSVRWIQDARATPITELVLLLLAWNIVIAVLAWFLVGSF
jgi:hypothetical protein